MTVPSAEGRFRNEVKIATPKHTNFNVSHSDLYCICLSHLDLEIMFRFQDAFKKAGTESSLQVVSRYPYLVMFGQICSRRVYKWKQPYSWSPRKLSGPFGSATLWAKGIAISQRCSASSKMLTSLTECMPLVILYGELSPGKKYFKKEVKMKVHIEDWEEDRVDS